jgi:excisionase family DNA binding protein
MDEHLLSARDVARLLHISLSYAYLLMKRGDIRTIHMGHAIRVRPEDLDRFLEEHGGNGADGSGFPPAA